MGNITIDTWRISAWLHVEYHHSCIGNITIVAWGVSTHCGNSIILAVRKTGHLNIKTKMFDFEARVLIGSLRVFASQPMRTRASKSNNFVFMSRWPAFLTASIV